MTDNVIMKVSELNNHKDGIMTEPYKTSNTPLAAYLLTEGYEILDVIFPPPGIRAYFLFANDSETFHQHIKDFELLRATTNAAQIIFNYQELVKRTKRGI